MFQPKAGYAAKDVSMPKIVRAVAYMPDKTYRVYNLEEGKWVPAANTDFSKWEEFEAPESVKATFIKGSGAKDCAFLRLTKEAQTRVSTGGFEA